MIYDPKTICCAGLHEGRKNKAKFLAMLSDLLRFGTVSNNELEGLNLISVQPS